GFERIAFENGELGHTRSLGQNVGGAKPEPATFRRSTRAPDESREGADSRVEPSWTGEGTPSLGSSRTNFNATLVVLHTSERERSKQGYDEDQSRSLSCPTRTAVGDSTDFLAVNAAL